MVRDMDGMVLGGLVFTKIKIEKIKMKFKKLGSFERMRAFDVKASCRNILGYLIPILNHPCKEAS